ncbi:AMP-binding protein [Kibdelosporangium persicum]|uniref:AMP-binding enzyme n=1 Tax=Kibdelosporangium persicum TaxID=2698649 RepID=A0ABX2F311_9PSEU|nr:AMP-binding protein [Kibdelosporangium persicum]NRN65519.1 AMP-binding enzyme [Kibdelosporangium persicum]
MPADLIVDVLNAARQHRSSPAVADRRGVITYGDLLAQVLGTAHHLRANGFTPGDRMLFSVRPGISAIVLALGTVAAGGTIVFVEPGGTPELFRSRADLVKPKWAAAESLLYSGLARAVARRGSLSPPAYRKLPVRHVRSGPWLPGVPRGALSAQKLAEPVSYNEFPVRTPDQDAVVVFTPQAVVHTRGSLGSGLRTLAERGSLGPGNQVHTEHCTLGLLALVAGAQWTVTSKPRPGSAAAFAPPRLTTESMG